MGFPLLSTYCLNIFVLDIAIKNTGQRSNQGYTMMLHIYTLNQCPYQVSSAYTLRFPRYGLFKIFKLEVTTVR